MAAAALLALIGCSPARRPQEEERWNRVVAALQQVAEEYRDALELRDQEAAQSRKLQLARFVDETSVAAGAIGGPLAEQIQRELRPVRARILGVDYHLGPDCEALVARILEQTRMRQTPRLKPDVESGKRLFAQVCAPCHGADGSGGAVGIGATMPPPPPNILNPPHNWSPYEMFNRVTYGGVETAMPSFEQGLTESERWDIVFHLFAERWPPCEKPLPPIGADELAVMGDFELGNLYGYGAAACLRRDFLPPR
jgi:mono/diheme cytochrome c family protein